MILVAPFHFKKIEILFNPFPLWYSPRLDERTNERTNDMDTTTANNYWTTTACISTGFWTSPSPSPSGSAYDNEHYDELFFDDLSPTANADDAYTIPHVPFMNLTKDERDKKSVLFKFGLCAHCDSGLDDKSDFVCDPRPNGAFVITCNACHEYFLQLRSSRVQYDGLGCN